MDERDEPEGGEGAECGDDVRKDDELEEEVEEAGGADDEADLVGREAEAAGEAGGCR